MSNTLILYQILGFIAVVALFVVIKVAVGRLMIGGQGTTVKETTAKKTTAREERTSAPSPQPLETVEEAATEVEPPEAPTPGGAPPPSPAPAPAAKRRASFGVDEPMAGAPAEEDLFAEEVRHRRVEHRRERGGGAEAPAPVDVDASLFAPARVPGESEFIVQVALHASDAEAERLAAEIARAVDPEAERRAQAPLDAPLSEGDVVELRLSAPGVEIEQPMRRAVWRGAPLVIAFVARFADPDAAGAIFRLQVILKGAPIGYAVARVMRVPADAPQTQTAAAPTRLERYRRAFLSYAHEDRLTVLRHNQLLSLVGIEVFQDITDIAPGEVWRHALTASIDQADLVLIYWSRHAAESAWVRMEVERALALREDRGGERPDIVPVILETPPPAPPPSFAALHFDDPMRFVIHYYETQTEAERSD